MSTAAACTGCEAACPDGSAFPDCSGPLFPGAKVTRLGELRQGRSERAEGCGGRTDTGACTVSCPQEIPLEVISQLHRDCPTATTGSRRTR